MVRQNVLKDLETYLDYEDDPVQREEIFKFRDLIDQGVDPDIVFKKLEDYELMVNVQKAKSGLADLVILFCVSLFFTIM